MRPMRGLRIVLTGGASQLTGVTEAAKRILLRQVRVGRPLGIQGLPESAKNPAFSRGRRPLIYPQVTGIEHFEPRGAGMLQATGTDGYLARVGRWLKDSF
jgi:cell division protein FtsA